MRMALSLAVPALFAAPVAGLALEAGVVVAKEIEPQAYAGTWYEIARTPAPFQERCEGGVTAEYELIDDNTMHVLNRCDLPQGETQSASGEADVVNGNFNTFDVQLSQSDEAPSINYVVAAVSDVVDGRYRWAAVHSPQSNIGWILSRSPELKPEGRAKAEAALEAVGVTISQLSDTSQPPQTYRPGDQ